MNIRHWSLSLLAVISLATFPLHAAQKSNTDGHDHDEHEHEHEHGQHSDSLSAPRAEHQEEQHEHNTDGHEEEAHRHGHDDHFDPKEAGLHEEPGHEKPGHEGHGHGIHDNDGVVELSPAQLKTAGIEIVKLEKRVIPNETLALGEISLNTYATSQVSPRIEGQVVKRHARLGDQVKAGQALVTLSSVAMSEAQANALITSREWQRVKKLGKKVVSDRRFLESQIAYQQALATLLAYGMTSQQVNGLIRSNDISGADGRYTLNALQNGVVIRDEFVLGQLVEPGQLLFVITDESELWVEARVNPDAITGVKTGASARVRIGEQWVDAEVIQIHHALDEMTRTIAVRLKIANPQDRFHPGQFVTASILNAAEDEAVISLPMNALLRSADGDWQVFVEQQPGRFEAREVEVVRQLSGLAVIRGLPVGTPVVTRGAFFVQSEQAKSSFEVHNH